MKMFHEAGVTYCVPPFTRDEQINVDYSGMQPIAYRYRHCGGHEGTDTVYIFPEGKKDFLNLLAHWNRAEDWTYTLL